MTEHSSWTLDDLRRELRRFETELRTANLEESSIATYVGRAEIFLRSLAGDDTPRGPRSHRGTK